MDSRRVFIFLLLMFFLFTAPDPHPSSPLHERERERQIAEERRSLALLNTSSYGDFDATASRWVPLAGLTKSDGFAWGLLSPVQDKARSQFLSVLEKCGIPTEPNDPPLSRNLADLSLPVYKNVTGIVRGDWTRWKHASDIHRPHLNFTSIFAEHEYFTREFGHNATMDHGSLVFNLHEQQSETVNINGALAREIKADLVIQNDLGFFGGSWLLSLFGVHFPETGAITLSTTSEKFAGLPALPHFALSGDSFELSRHLLNNSLSEALSERQNRPPPLFPWSSLPHGPNTGLFPSPKCEYVVYLQQHPVLLNGEIARPEVLWMIEDELRFPRGAPIPAPPPMVMSAVMFSPDCGFVLETNSVSSSTSTETAYLSGPKQEEYIKYAARFITIVGCVISAQVVLLMRQMKDASTPSTRSRVSFYTVAMMSMGDALFMAFVLLELYPEASFLLLTVTSFLAFFSVSFLGMKFQIEIWTAQAPERTENTYRHSPRTPTENSPPLPLPATAARSTVAGAAPDNTVSNQGDVAQNSQPVQPQEGNATGSDAGTMYTRFYFVLFSLLFFSSWALFWPSGLRILYANILSFIYLSFWTPQIYRNMIRNCRKALRWEFVIGESILRVFPFLYFYGVPRNVLFIKASPTITALLFAWVSVQGWFLVSQDILGPRFFVPKGWVPPAYDYHPVLQDTSSVGPEEELTQGGTLPVTSLRAEQRQISAQGPDNNRQVDRGAKRVFNCAICMQDIEVPVLLTSTAGGVSGGAANLLARRAYMVTPCQHLFHSACLETWMRLRLQCPICRETIPPI